VVAAIGLVAGAGFPILAAISALLVLATLAVLEPIERRLFHRNRESGIVNRE
jgi:uncharacterized membrane protein YhiD involved in acid resistance